MKEFKLKKQSLSNFGSSKKFFQLWISPSPNFKWRGRSPFFKYLRKVCLQTLPHSLPVFKSKSKSIQGYPLRIIFNPSRFGPHLLSLLFIKQLEKPARKLLVQKSMNLIGTCISHFDSKSNILKLATIHRSPKRQK
jgi:hypothetical protein